MSSKPKSARRATSRANPVNHHVRLRKISNYSPNLDLSAYDRTDPFTALNTLVKLLSSLPSRIGGCQYKFTPEEHGLSLHLLNIVEPFVGLAPCRRTITRQPTEILDAIVYHVESTNDLLSFALSCRRMHSIIIPRHLNYRVIRCKLSSISIWNHLSTHRSLARNVRRLEILDERSNDRETIPPGILVTDTDLDSTDDELGLHAKHERYLVSALGKMSALTSFSWSCNHAPIAIDSIWPILQKCRSLQDVQICDNVLFSNPTSINPPEASSHASRKAREDSLHSAAASVKTLALRSTRHAYGAAKVPSLARINAMLNDCPYLESLEVSYVQAKISTNNHPVVDEMVLLGRWSNLTHLYLNNLRCSANGVNAVAAFLSAHRNLQVLHLDVISSANVSYTTFPILPNSLPYLHEIKSNRNIVNAILTCPADTPRPLTTIRGVRLSNFGSSEETTFLENLRIHGKGVKRLELAGWADIEDIRRLCDVASGLTWLDIGAKSGAPCKDKNSVFATPVVNVMEWANVLTLLPELSTIHGVRFFYEVSSNLGPSASTSYMTMADRSRMRKNDEIASILAWKCPKLRRVDHWEGRDRVIVLLRDGDKDRDKVRWEVRKVKQ